MGILIEGTCLDMDNGHLGILIEGTCLDMDNGNINQRLYWLFSAMEEDAHTSQGSVGWKLYAYYGLRPHTPATGCCLDRTFVSNCIRTT